MSDPDRPARDANAIDPGLAADRSRPHGDASKDITDVRPEDMGSEATALGAEMGDSSLNGIPGLGTLQVVRDRNGRQLHLEGTWRPHDGDTDVSELDRSVDAGSPIRFEGRLHDPAAPDRNRCEVDVRITSRSVYTYDAREEDDGRTLPLFNFEPIDAGDLSR